MRCPVRRLERASAEAEGGVAWTGARNRDAAAAGALKTRLPPQGRRVTILPTVKIVK